MSFGGARYGKAIRTRGCAIGTIRATPSYGAASRRKTQPQNPKPPHRHLSKNLRVQTAFLKDSLLIKWGASHRLPQVFDFPSGNDVLELGMLSENEILAGLNTPSGEGEETAEIYRREARAKYGIDNENAATHLLDAAYANDRDDNPVDVIVRDLKLAVAIGDNVSWIFAAAHRLLLKHGLWREALDIIEREIELTDDIDERVDLCMTAADLYGIVANQRDKALEFVDKALALNRDSPSALYDGIGFGDDKTREKNALALAKILGAPQERAVLFALAGSIQIAHGNESDALNAYTQAALADKSTPYPQLHCAILNEKLGKRIDAAQNYAQVAQILEDNALSGTFYRRAAVMLDIEGQREKSSFYVNEAQKRVENPFETTWIAAEAARKSGNPSRAIAFEQEIIDSQDDDDIRATHWLKIADICLEDLHDTDQALHALEVAFTLGRGDVADAQIVGMYQNRGDWKSCAAALQHMTQNASLDLTCLQWMLGLALYRDGNLDDAIAAFSEIQGALGWFHLALILDASGKNEELARTLDAWMRATNDCGMHDALLSQLITVVTERLHAPEIAAQYLKKEIPTRASRDLLWKKIRLAASLHQWDALVESLQQLALETADEAEARVWQMEAAQILAFEQNRIDEAVDVLRKIHEKSPNDASPIAFLHAIGMKERRGDLVILANTWLENFQLTVAQRVAITLENARIYQRHGDVENAIAAYHRARNLQPLDDYHLAKVVDLLKSQARWQETIDVLEDALKARGEDDEDVDLTRDEDDENEHEDAQNIRECDVFRAILIDLKSFCLPRKPAITAQLKACFDRDPSVSTAIPYLLETAVHESPEKLQAVTGAIRVMVTNLSQEARALLNWCEAEILRHQHPKCDAHTASSILNLLKKSLEQRYGTSLRAEILRCLREAERENVTMWLERYAQMTPDRRMSMMLSREAALRAIWIDDDEDTARHALVGARDDADRRTLWLFEHFSDAYEDWKALGYFREKLAALEVSTRARLQTLKGAMAPYLDEGLDDHAVRVAQECLKLDGHAFPALLTLAHVAEDNGDIQSLAAIADRLAEASECPENRAEYGLWAAQIWNSALHRPEQAASSLERLLAQNPTCLPAIEFCEQLYEQLDRLEQLGRIYARAIAAMHESDDQIDILRKQSALLATRLDDAPAACLALEKLVKLSPNDLEALNMLADLLSQQARWSEAVDVYDRIAKIAQTPEQKRLVNLKLADILVHQIDQPDRAKVILKRHLVWFEHDMPALELLYDIARTERNWVEARATLEEICRDEGSKEARQARLAFTRIAREAAWSHDTRTLYERQAIAAVIGHREDFDALVGDYRAHDELPRLIDVAKRELTKQSSIELMAQYRGCVAALYVANHQHREALAFLSEIIQDSQNTDWAYLARAQALTSAGQLDSAVGEFRRTLSRNIELDDAYAPFIDVLRQTGDDISRAAIEALRDLLIDGQLQPPWTRCIKGIPRGYFDVEQIPMPRTFIDAQRYLRTMSPYAFELFPDEIDLTPIDPAHWVFGRCHRLFGQNFEMKQAFSTRGLTKELCRVRLQQSPALIFDESLLDENNPIAFDFWTAYAMHQAVTGACLMDALPDATLEALFTALCQAKPEAALAQTLKKRLFHVLPRPERKLFKDGVPFLAPNWSDFRDALQARAACVAAVISASPAYALHVHPKNVTLKKFLISESYVRFIKTYWTNGER